jgi:DNA-binding transcriptional LysR family regulator
VDSYTNGNSAELAQFARTYPEIVLEVTSSNDPIDLVAGEFDAGGQLGVSPQGPASFDNPDLVIQAVLNGVGIGTAMEETLTGMISEGRLIQVLRAWCPTFGGYFLYYPSRRNQPAALSALIDTLRVSD